MTTRTGLPVPIVSIVDPVALADGLAGSVPFRANATDNVGVTNVEFQIDGVPLTPNVR